MRNACHDFWGSQELGRKLPGFLDPNCPAVVIPLHTWAFHPTQHAFLRHRWRSTRPGRLEQLESADPVLKLGSAEMMRTWVSWWGILLSGLLRKTMVDSGELHGCHFYINLCAYCCTWRTLPLFRELGALGQLDVPFSWSDSRSCSHPIYSTIACSENGRQMGTAGIAMPSYARLSLLVSDEARVSTDSQSSPNGVRYKWANALVPPTPFQGWRKKCADI